MGDELGALAEEVWLLSLGWHFSQGAGSKFGSVELGEKVRYFFPFPFGRDGLDADGEESKLVCEASV